MFKPFALDKNHCIPLNLVDPPNLTTFDITYNRGSQSSWPILFEGFKYKIVDLRILSSCPFAVRFREEFDLFYSRDCQGDRT